MSTLDHWQQHPIEFIETVLYDPESSKPFVLLDAERNFLQYAFKTDADGRLLYPEQLYGAPKKSGKTGLAALHMLTTLLLFGGHLAEGYCLANDEEQAASRVFAAIKNIVEARPLLKNEAKITVDKITFPAFSNATICTATSNPASVAGANPTISVFDELWGYTTERSHRLWDEMVPPPTRKIACRLTVTYAGFSGECALLENLYNRGLQQQQVAPSLYAGDGLLMLWSHEPLAPWQDEKWLAQMRRDLRPNQYLRMIENRFVAGESSFIDMAHWDACVDPSLSPSTGGALVPIWVGIDASTKHDSSALVAVTYNSKENRVRLVKHKVFTPTPDRPISFDSIEATILEWKQRFQLCKVLVDPFQMASTVEHLKKSGIKTEEYGQTSASLIAASQNLYDLIQSQRLSVYPSAEMRLAISRAVALESTRGWRLGKSKANHHVDIVIALAMAAHAAVQSRTQPLFAPDSTWVSGAESPQSRAEADYRWRRANYFRAIGVPIPFK